MPKIFKVYNNKTGRKVFEGTVKMCREYLSMCDSAVRDAAERGHLVRGIYKIVDCSNQDDETEVSGASAREAIEAWDAFCEPIRKKYNIPVYKAKPEVRR